MEHFNKCGFIRNKKKIKIKQSTDFQDWKMQEFNEVWNSFPQKQHSSDHRIIEVGKTSGDLYSKLMFNTCLKTLKVEHMTAYLPVRILAVFKTQLQKYVLRGTGLQLKASSAAADLHQEQQ